MRGKGALVCLTGGSKTPPHFGEGAGASRGAVADPTPPGLGASPGKFRLNVDRAGSLSGIPQCAGHACQQPSHRPGPSRASCSLNVE